MKHTLTLLTALLLAGMAFGELGAVVATAAQPTSPDARGPAIVPGLVGKAFLVDSPEHEFSFRTRGRFHPAQGTVEFWVQPQREIGAEDFEGVLYRTIDPLSSSQGIQVIFYRRGVLVNTKLKTGWDVNRVFPVRFAARSWHHLALSWHGAMGRFYVDGQLAGQFPMKSPDDCAPSTYVGALAGRYVSHSAIDELHVCGMPLSAEEIRGDYEKGRQHQALETRPGQTLLLLSCDELPRRRKCALTACWKVQPDPKACLPSEPNPIDALGPTDWFQGQWPSDPSMPEPRYPRFSITPVAAREPGVTIRKLFPMDPGTVEPAARLSLETSAGTAPLYGGTPPAQIAYRVGNLLRLIDPSPPAKRSVEVIVASHRLWLIRVRFSGPAECLVRLEAECDALLPSGEGESRGPLMIIPSDLGWCGFQFFPGRAAGEALLAGVYDASSREALLADLEKAGRQAERFDAFWQELARAHSVEPFLTGKETPTERNLVAACVNRVLRNVRTGGNIGAPAMVEFFGPTWAGADMVWICFQPACRYALWIEPTLWANSLRTLLDPQTSEGMVPQFVGQKSIDPITQIPNISPVLRDYYVFTKDRRFLEYAYPRFKRWYAWFLAKRNPTRDGIMAVGDATLSLWDSICEYKDNGTDPTKPSFEDTCMPLTRTAEIAGRPERVYLPDIVACQARMAEDLAFLAGELGLKEDADYFAGEYRRVRDWANTHLWDERTKFYYPVVRATGKKLMKRSNTAFWLLWAGIPDEAQKDALVAAMFDPQQFYSTIPLPMIALNDPSFNPKCGHWGDGYCWPIDALHAFDGLLRYGEWDRAAELARHYNRGVFAAIEKTQQPNEFYHHTGKPMGVGDMATAGCLPLVFQRYLRDYRAGQAAQEWARFAPAPPNRNLP